MAPDDGIQRVTAMSDIALDDEIVQRVQDSIDAASDDGGESASADAIKAAYLDGRDEWSLPEEEAIGYAIDEVAVDGNVADDARGIYFGRGGAPTGHVQIADLDPLHEAAADGESAWLDVKVKVTRVWGADSDAVYRRLQVGDETGRTTLTIFQNAADAIELNSVGLEEGDTFWVEDAVTERFNGSVNLKVTTAASLAPTSDDFDPDVPEPREEFTAQVTGVNSASGLIPRCPVEECSYVLDSNRCREHGPQDEVTYDLRLKLQVGTGAETYEFIVGREATAALTGINLEQAKAMATDAADYTVVEDTMAQALHGKTVTGEVLAWGDTYVVEEIAVLESAPDPKDVLQDVREMGSFA
jgi:replication factor A1